MYPENFSKRTSTDRETHHLFSDLQQLSRYTPAQQSISYSKEHTYCLDSPHHIMHGSTKSRCRAVEEQRAPISHELLPAGAVALLPFGACLQTHLVSSLQRHAGHGWVPQRGADSEIDRSSRARPGTYGYVSVGFGRQPLITCHNFCAWLCWYIGDQANKHHNNEACSQAIRNKEKKQSQAKGDQTKVQSPPKLGPRGTAL